MAVEPGDAAEFAVSVLRKDLKMNAAAHERMKRWLVTVLRRAGVAP